MRRADRVEKGECFLRGRCRGLKRERGLRETERERGIGREGVNESDVNEGE